MSSVKDIEIINLESMEKRQNDLARRAMSEERERCARLAQVFILPSDPDWVADRLHDLADAIRNW